MSFEASSTCYERLNNIVISLGMEVSDSILSALRNEVEACRQEQRKDLAIVGPVLLGIDAVIRHIDEIRALADARAFHLLNELMQAYRMITEECQEPQKAWAVASEALDKVLAWQHSCIQESQEKVQNASSVAPALSESPTFDMKGLLGAVRQEIAATGMMAIRESAALLELVHVQKESAGSADPEESKEKDGDAFSSVVRENISSLQQTLHQEMGRLRHDFIGD
ncbi:MAG: hypothetical protein WGN25_05825 [Candidatus Electrothrix sp. GW3-4]|uniref:hypothetical protein n=1 Tax=Candidatus Electrothrix sp. GW3-4 TaxID=3126740 RepID=UPI0030CB724C